jgi:hypothetical protein
VSRDKRSLIFLSLPLWVAHGLLALGLGLDSSDIRILRLLVHFEGRHATGLEREDGQALGQCVERLCRLALFLRR